MRLKIIVLACLVFLAGFLRFFNIAQNPPSLTWDEVAWGYNAYALGIDGKDEFGNFLPLAYLESFGDFKPPMYAYLAILPVKLFGLNEFSTRFPSAFFGTLTVLISYFLVKEIFYRSKRSIDYAFFTAFLLAISPWHINLSRAAFEANIASFFIILGVWQFLVGIRKKAMTPFLVASIAFVLSFYTFNTARIVSPLLILGFTLGFKKELLQNKKNIILAATIGLLLLLPLIPFLGSSQAKLRFEEVNIFSDVRIIERTNSQIAQDNNEWWSKLIHNRRLTFAVEYMRHYFDNLTPNFLFIRGDGNPKFSTQDVGQLYMWELPFLLIGILLLFGKKESYWWMVPLWLIIGIVPAATARETPHALRIETVLPTFQIVVAYGVVNVLQKVFETSFKYAFSVGLTVMLLGNLAYYLYGYHSHYPREYSGEWQYGYKDAISYIKKNENVYDRIYFTDALGRPYAYFLFYLRYNPEHFRKYVKLEREAFGFVHVRSFDKYFFAKDVSILPSDSKKILYIDVPNNVPEGADVKKIFYLKNNLPSLVAYTI